MEVSETYQIDVADLIGYTCSRSKSRDRGSNASLVSLTEATILKDKKERKTYHTPRALFQLYDAQVDQ